MTVDWVAPATESQRFTSSPTVVKGATRTAAATAARRLAAAQRAAFQFGMTQVEVLDDAHLVALAVVLLGEARRRGLEVPDPDE